MMIFNLTDEDIVIINKQIEEKEFKKVLGFLCNYYEKEITPAIVLVYWQFLKNYTQEEIQEAAEYWVYWYSMFPTPSNLAGWIINNIRGIMKKEFQE